jgi:hypothetical protein
MPNKEEIYQSLDMRGNRISNFVVDEPTAAQNPVPLDYLEESQTYDTAAVESQNNSPVMSWAKNLKNLTLKPLLDAVIFPIVNPIWTEPTFTGIRLTVIGELFIQAGVHLLFEGSQKTMRLDYSIVPGDRISGVTAVLKITKNDGTFVTFNSTTTSDIGGTINFTFDFTDIASMVISKVWQPSSAVKNDNYGNPFKPAEFNTNYTSSFDALALLEEGNVVSPPMVYKTLTDETLYSAGLTASMNFASLPGFVSDKRFFLQPGNNQFVVLIPTALYNNCEIFAIFSDDNVPIPKSVLTPSGSFLSMEITYFGVIEDYTVCTVDFGFFAVQTNVDLQFIVNSDNN